MRKLITLLSTCLAFAYTAQAQTPTPEQKLYYTCKVWGFVKYYHSGVSVCSVNWDSVLLHVLPMVQSATTSDQFNDALDTMLAAAGPMAIATTPPPPDTVMPNLKYNRDWGWTHDVPLRTDVQVQLDTIKNNFRPHISCWYGHNLSGSASTLGSTSGGYMIFPHDTLLLPVTSYTTFPDVDHRLLQLFKFWNIVRYFNPYNYVLDTPWDTTLYHYVLPITAVPNAYELYRTYLRMARQLDDAHVYGLTYNSYYQSIPGYYSMRVSLKYIDGKYIVTRSQEPNIFPGDAIVSVDGKTTAEWEDSLKQYYSAGNPAVLHRTMASNLLRREISMGTVLVGVEDSTGAVNTYSRNTVNPASYSSFFYSGYHYPNDSLSHIKWTTMRCDIGYVNMGNLQLADVAPMYSSLQTKSAIIIDMRNYPNGTAWDISYQLFSHPTPFAILSFPDTTFPGLYYYETQYAGGSVTSPYLGKIIVLVDENTQSQAEYSTMLLRAGPNTVVLGSQTAGADGNVTWLRTCEDMSFGWTSLGVYYPNWDSTQRVGIVPDTVAYPTQEGIRHKRDYVLERALAAGGCSFYTSVQQVGEATVNIFPNPARDEFEVRAENLGVGTLSVVMTDITGKVLQQKEVASTGSASVVFDVKAYQPGIYLVTVKAGDHQQTAKLVKVN